MNFSNPQIEHLKRMLNVEEKRAQLLQQLGALDAELAALKRQLDAGGTVAAAPSGRGGRGRPRGASINASTSAPATGKKRRTVRGKLAERIVGALKAAGPSGITIKELCSQLKVDYRNVQVWFATTGKKYSGIRKIAPATYRMVG